MSDSLLEEIRSDIKEIKGHVVELVSRVAVHNHILTEHEKRSTNLEHRIEPLERIYIFGSKAVTIMGALVAGLGSLAMLYHYLFK